MEGVLVSLLMLVVGLGFIALFVKWYTAFCYRKIVSDKSEVLEQLLLTGAVPEAWRHPGLERFGQTHCPALERLLIRRYARRLNGVMALVKGNAHMGAEKKREGLEALREIQGEWLKCKTLHSLVG